MFPEPPLVSAARDATRCSICQVTDYVHLLLFSGAELLMWMYTKHARTWVSRLERH